MSTNTAAIHSTWSNGRYSLLSLVISTTIYNTITNIPFVRLLNLGLRPITPTNTITRATLQAQERYTKVLNIFKEVEYVNQALNCYYFKALTIFVIST